jgi:polyribonucleotide nucleotidyltransferase
VEITKIDDRGKLSLSPVVAEEENADKVEVAEATAE